ncbi:sugar kinase [Sphingomonas rosea]|uniref:Sugar kinase n=1 Tax=Sphingomonas rosea TaxID=335605 RepID=A0ABP7U8Y0_9SPHN
MIACFGELLIRLSPPDRKMLVQADTLDVSVGGAEANVAAGLASLGHEVRFVGKVSGNPLGDRAVAALRAAGVDTRFLQRSTDRMGLYFLEQGAGARPSSIVYDRTGSGHADGTAGDIDFAGALAGARLLHSGGIIPALGPGGAAIARASHAAAKAHDAPICFDVNYREHLWGSWESDPRAVLTELVGDATILIGGPRDIAMLLERPFFNAQPDERRAAAEAAFAAFPRLQLIASTHRSVSSDHHHLSARVDSRTGASQTEAIRLSAIVDRIGTGDAFAAGVLDQWLAGGDEAAMANSGLALAALKHSLPGDLCLIRREMLEAFRPDGGDVRR